MENEEGKNIKCPVCGENATCINMQSCFRIECPICKAYNIGNAFHIPTLSEDEKIKLRFVYYYMLDEFNEQRLSISVNDSNKTNILSKISAPKDILEKKDYILNYLSENTNNLGEPVVISFKNGYRRFFCQDNKEFLKILESLENNGYIDKDNDFLIKSFNEKDDKRNIVITIEGLEYAKKIFNKFGSNKCFVAMWFDSSTNILSNSIKSVIDSNTNYKFIKIDEMQHINYIPLEILNEIKQSRFIIADLTGHRGGVYYEIGYAEGLGIPVILTCNNKWLNDLYDGDGKLIHQGVHFDLKQKNILLWADDAMDDLKKNLIARIKKVVGLGKSETMEKDSDNIKSLESKNNN